MLNMDENVWLKTWQSLLPLGSDLSKQSDYSQGKSRRKSSSPSTPQCRRTRNTHKKDDIRCPQQRSTSNYDKDIRCFENKCCVLDITLLPAANKSADINQLPFTKWHQERKKNPRSWLLLSSFTHFSSKHKAFVWLFIFFLFLCNCEW